jgi:hypothetical protein
MLPSWRRIHKWILSSPHAATDAPPRPRRPVPTAIRNVGICKAWSITYGEQGLPGFQSQSFGLISLCFVPGCYTQVDVTYVGQGGNFVNSC